MFGTTQFKIIAVVVLALAAYGGYRYVNNLHDENVRLTAENAIISQKLTEQNEAIEAWKKEADAKLAAAQDEIEKAKKETAAARTRAQSFFRAKPSTPGDACKSALDLINGGGK